MDLWQGTFEVMDLRGQRARRARPAPQGASTTRRPGAGLRRVLCGRDAVQVRRAARRRAWTCRALAARLAARGRRCTANEYLVRFRATEAELVVFEDGRAIVKGVRDAAQARSLYAKYVGS